MVRKMDKIKIFFLLLLVNTTLARPQKDDSGFDFDCNFWSFNGHFTEAFSSYENLQLQDETTQEKYFNCRYKMLNYKDVIRF